MRILFVLSAIETNLSAELRVLVPTNYSFFYNRMFRCELQSLPA